MDRFVKRIGSTSAEPDTPAKKAKQSLQKKIEKDRHYDKNNRKREFVFFCHEVFYVIFAVEYMQFQVNF